MKIILKTKLNIVDEVSGKYKCPYCDKYISKYGILRKAVPNIFNEYGIEVYSTPLVLTIK